MGGVGVMCMQGRQTGSSCAADETDHRSMRLIKSWDSKVVVVVVCGIVFAGHSSNRSFERH